MKAAGPPIGPNPPPKPPLMPPNPPPPDPPPNPPPPPPNPPIEPRPAAGPLPAIAPAPPPAPPPALRPRGASACSLPGARDRFCNMLYAARNSLKLILPSWSVSIRLNICLPRSLFWTSGLARNSSSFKKPSLSLSKSFMTCAGRGGPFLSGLADGPRSGGSAAIDNTAGTVRASATSPAVVKLNLDIRKISFQETITKTSRPQPIGGDF